MDRWAGIEPYDTAFPQSSVFRAIATNTAAGKSHRAFAVDIRVESSLNNDCSFGIGRQSAIGWVDDD